MKIIVLIFLVKFALVRAQVPYLGTQKEDVIKQCEKEVNFSNDEYQKLLTDSGSCKDRINESDAARCYHVCILKKRNYLSDSEDYIAESIMKLYSQLRKEYIQWVLDGCTKNYHSSEGKCHKGYYMHKCFAENIGSIPHLTKHVTISNVCGRSEKKCRDKTGITKEEICQANSGTETDLYEKDEKAKCYHTCILEEMGFLDDKGLKEEAVKKRFFYIPEDEYKKAYEDCNKSFTKEDKCDVVYGTHKCFKKAFGEYPIGDVQP